MTDVFMECFRLDYLLFFPDLAKEQAISHFENSLLIRIPSMAPAMISVR